MASSVAKSVRRTSVSAVISVFIYDRTTDITSVQRHRRNRVIDRLQQASKQAVPELMREDSAEFQSMFRMDMMAFEQLLDMVAPQIAKENTVMRMSISPKEKLLVTLRYLATG